MGEVGQIFTQRCCSPYVWNAKSDWQIFCKQIRQNGGAIQDLFPWHHITSAVGMENGWQRPHRRLTNLLSPALIWSSEHCFLCQNVTNWNVNGNTEIWSSICKKFVWLPSIKRFFCFGFCCIQWHVLSLGEINALFGVCSTLQKKTTQLIRTK